MDKLSLTRNLLVVFTYIVMSSSVNSANAQAFRNGATNDPFWKCDTGGNRHEVWIGGENRDLIVLGELGSSVSSGVLFRVQDGHGYVCGSDVVSGQNFTALRYGNRRDIVDIFIHSGSNRFQRNTDRIHDGRKHGMVVGQNYVARLYGNHKDILKLYGIKSDGTIVTKARFINDGREHILKWLSSTDVGLTYGRNKDINVRFCFDGKRWLTGYIGIGHGFKAKCDAVLKW